MCFTLQSAYVSDQQHLLLSKCNMTGLFSTYIRISLLLLLGDKRSCMLPISMFLLVRHGHIACHGMVQVWYGTRSYTVPHTIPYTN